MADLQVAAVYTVAILQERDLELDPPDMLPGLDGTFRKLPSRCSHLGGSTFANQVGVAVACGADTAIGVLNSPDDAPAFLASPL